MERPAGGHAEDAAAERIERHAARRHVGVGHQPRAQRRGPRGHELDDRAVGEARPLRAALSTSRPSRTTTP